MSARKDSKLGAAPEPVRAYVTQASELGQSLQLQKANDPKPALKAREIAKAILQACPTAKLPELLELRGFSELLDEHSINKFAFRDALASERNAIADKPVQSRSKLVGRVKPNAPPPGLWTASRRLDDVNPNDL